MKDKCLLFIGLLAAFTTGAIQPCNSILFGDLTGIIIHYATALAMHNETVLKKAEDDLMDGISYFAIMNSLIGLVMLVCSYLSTVTFNYAAMRQVESNLF